MTNNEKQELYRLLNEWFSETDLDKRNITNKDRIARLIKKELTKSKNWKDKPRGLNNSADSLNKGKMNKEKLVKKIQDIESQITNQKCGCGSKMVKRGNRLICEGVMCEFSIDFTE